MRRRSQIHMLAVAAARLESDHANPKLIADLQAAAHHLATARADGRGHDDEEERRIERQRTLFTMLPDIGATERLRLAMQQRAYDLMWDGDCLACDALLEFLPSKFADEVLDGWENDQAAGSVSKTKFYEGIDA